MSLTPAASNATAPTLRRIEDLPGPTGWPVLGNLPQVNMVRIHRDMEDLSVKYGPYFRVRLGKAPLLVVADHEAIGTLMRDRPDGWRRNANLSDVMLELGSASGVFIAEGEAWQRQRRMVMAAFAPTHVRAYLPALREVTRRLQSRWRRMATGTESIDLLADLKRYTVDVIAGLAFGTEVNTLEAGEDRIQQHLDIVLAGIRRRLMSPFPYWRWIKLPADRRVEHSSVVILEAIGELVAKARARLAAHPELREQPGNLLEAMLAAVEREGSGIENDEVVGNVSTMLFAGEDTTASTLAWMIHLMHRNPETWRRAVVEVEALPADPGSWTLEQLDSLAWVEACADEAMRMKPVAPFLRFDALRDTIVADIAVPRGTTVWCVMRHDGMSARFFPDPNDYDPTRWLADGAARPSGGSPKRISMPFGAGPRLCPGRYLALLEIKLVAAMLLKGFDVDSLVTPHGEEAAEIMGFTLNPAGLTMRLRERG